MRDLVQFDWDMSGNLPDGDPDSSPIVCVEGEATDATEVLQVITRALTLNDGLGGSGKRLIEKIRNLCEDGLGGGTLTCAIAKHGQRIIGASVLTTEKDSENHLVSGPCVLPEYQNRGVGSALLRCSLEILQKHEIPLARAACPAQTACARYVYPKFGGRIRAELPSIAANEQPVGSA